MRVLVCGSRHYEDRRHLETTLEQWNISTLLEGGARGADRLARVYAEKRGIAIETFEAAWNEYGRSAGHIRNAKMVSEGKPQQVIAFWDGKSRGTKHMIEISRKAGIPVEVIEIA